MTAPRQLLPHYKELLEQAFIALDMAGRQDCADALSRLLDEMLKADARLTAVTTLHRPVGYDKYSHETLDPAAAVQYRCKACCYSVTAKGCPTFLAAVGGSS